ncbi:MAG: dihydrolipoyl dehydrogenase [Acidimicrobiia bacterium]|jgi:dihydrolipoamide dehydrogenase
MATDSYDVAILGGGPGGYATAFFSNSLGLRPVVIEKDLVGGTCLHRGCIPAKTWLNAAETYATIAEAEAFGVRANDVEVDWPTALRRKETVVSGLHRGLRRTFEHRDIPVVTGVGRVSGPGELSVEGPDGAMVVSADKLVVATGSRPMTVPGFEVDGRYVVSSDEALEWEERPASVVIIGGGAIGCEFASLLSDLGSEVTVIEMLDQILPGVDVDVARELQGRLRRRGVRFLLGTSAGPPSIHGDKVRIETDGETVESDVVLVAVGRRPNTEGIGLEEAGVTLDRGFVEVDHETMETRLSGVFAVGDIVAGTPQLAHAGFAEGLTASRFIATGEKGPVDYSAIPLVVYTRPEVAQIGLTEKTAGEMGVEVQVHQRPFGGSGRAMIKGEKRGIVKLLISDSNQLVGASIAGPHAGELIHELMITLGTHTDITDVGPLIHAHPSLSETIGESLLAASGLGLH